jgi:predicted dehydrogenase
VALVGSGGIAAVHAKAIASQAQRATLVACADMFLPKAAELAAGFSARAYDDYRAMISTERPDLVVVATWPNLHEEQVLESIRLGARAILCEKSMAMDAPSAARMAAAAKAAGCLLMEGFMGRHLPRTLQLKQWVDEGRIGRVGKIRAVFQRPALVGKVNWKHNPAYGGVVFDFTCYGVNALGLFHHALPARVHAILRRREDGLNTEMQALLSYPDGVVGIVESSYYNAFQQVLELHGETGILRIQNAWIGTGEEGIELINGTKVEVLATPAMNRAEAQLLHLCDCVQLGHAPRFTVDEAVRNHCVIDAMMESAQRGLAVEPRLP